MVTGLPNQHRTWRTGVRRVAGLFVAVASAAVLADQVARALRVVTSTTSAPSSAVGGPWWVAALSLAVLVGVGVLPAWRLVGSRPLAVFLAPCMGALVAGLSAVVAVVAGDLLRWFVAMAAAINAAALSSAIAPRDRRAQGRVGPPWSWGPATVVSVVVLAAAIAGVVGFAAAGAPGGPGGTQTWLAMAGVLAGGQDKVHQAVTAPGSAGVRLLASPLASGATSITWLVSGRRAIGAADVVVGALSASVVGAAACAISELARSISHGLDRHARSLPSARIVELTGLVGAAGWVLAAFGALAESGGQVDNATVTLLWASAAVGAVAFGLVLSTDRWRLRTVVILGAVSALAAPAGGVAAAVVAIVVTFRRVAAARRRGSGTGWWADVIGGALAVASTLAWPIAAVVIGAVPVRFASLPLAQVQRRLSSTWAILEAHLAPVAIALGVALVAAVLLRRERAARELGSDMGSVVVGATSLAVVLVAWSWLAPLLAPWRLATVSSAVVFPLLLASFAMATWMVVGVAVASGATPARSGPSDAGAMGTDVQHAGSAATRTPAPGMPAPGMAAPGTGTAGMPATRMPGAGTGTAGMRGPGMGTTGTTGPRVDGPGTDVLHRLP